MEELRQTVRDNNLTDWYARQYVDKVAEYRVFIVCNRVVKVSEKIPADRDSIAWNLAQGGSFTNVRWDSWPMEAIRKSLKAMQLTGLHFGGVDVMVDREGNSYILEANSAPTIPSKSDGEPSYGQKCMAKGFAYHINQDNWDQLDTIDNPVGWRDVIHPGVFN